MDNLENLSHHLPQKLQAIQMHLRINQSTPDEACFLRHWSSGHRIGNKKLIFYVTVAVRFTATDSQMATI